MNFFDKLTKRASKTYQVTKEKTVKFSEEMKLKMKVNNVKSEIANLYEDIGEKVYNQYKNNSDENTDEIKSKCEEISKKLDEISKMELEILKLRKVKKCVECKEEIDDEAEYCPKCGKSQPKSEEKVEVEEKIPDENEVKDVEVEEISNSDNEN